MSLIRQIWLLLLGSLLLVFGGSVTVSVGAARDSLQTQLRLKNSDNATALAQVLSQQQGDLGRMTLVMTAQFDTGYYQEIRFTNPQGEVVFLRQGDQQPLHAPAWFSNLLPMESEPGMAQVASGWQPLGTVQVTSHSAFVQDDLWQGALKAAAALALVLGLAVLLAAGVVGRIKRPLAQAVAQAQSLVNGEFVTIEASNVPELARLTHAMNTMVNRLRLIFEAQAQQVESLRLQAHCDALTGLSNRKHFLVQLTASLQREDGPMDGGLVLLRVNDLAEVNRQIGYESADRLLTTIAQALQTYTERASGCHLGRLNGSDFALYLPVGGVALETGSALVQALRVLLPAFGPRVSVAVGAVEVERSRPVAQIMAAADAALARAESQPPFSVVLDVEPINSPALLGQDAWRQSIGSALVKERARLVCFPVIDSMHQLVHLECPLRLRLDPEGPYEVAARWLPLAVRSRLTPMVDERAVSLALAAITQDDMPRCVNLCAASLGDPHFAPRLRALLEQCPQEAKRLWLEVPELAAIDHFEWMLELGRQLRPCGVRLGLEHAGERLSQIDQLFEAGLHYVKLDAAVVQGVAGDSGKTEFVRGVVTMLHGLSLQVYAEGVTETADADVLWKLGMDGVTGPWASRERADWVLGTGPG